MVSNEGCGDTQARGVKSDQVRWMHRAKTLFISAVVSTRKGAGFDSLVVRTYARCKVYRLVVPGDG